MLVVKNLPANSRNIKDMDSITGSGRLPGGGHANPLQYSLLENPMNRGVWRAIAHGVARARHGLAHSIHTHITRNRERSPSVDSEDV